MFTKQRRSTVIYLVLVVALFLCGYLISGLFRSTMDDPKVVPTTVSVLPSFQPLPVLAKEEKPDWKECVVTTYDDPRPSKWVYHGRNTASGEIFSNHELTAAVKYGKGKRPIVPFGTLIEVKKGNRTVIVRVTDTGSYSPKKFWLDLSGAAMRKLLDDWECTKVNATYRILESPVYN